MLNPAHRETRQTREMKRPRKKPFKLRLDLLKYITPEDALEEALANNSRYGLAASIWSENINLALDIAPKLKAGVVWINSTNMFDAACGFGGYRESGFGREGGREGMYEYMVADWIKALPRQKDVAAKALSGAPARSAEHRRSAC